MAIIEFERRGPVGVITLNRPEIRNAFDSAMAKALGAAIDELEADRELRVGVLQATITEPRPVFCAGHDLRTIEDERDGGERAETERGGFGGLVQYPRSKPLIAAVDGLATSGGLEIVLGLVSTLVEADAEGAAKERATLIAGNGPLAVSASLQVADKAFALPESALWVENDKAIDKIINSAELVAGVAAFAVKSG
jgi:enoyl-CoA hydratase/carnithine racemase